MSSASPQSPVPVTGAPALVAMQADPVFADLPADERRRLVQLITALTGIQRPGITAQLRALAPRLDISYSTLRRYKSILDKGGGWRELADHRRLRQPERDRTRDPGFVSYFRQLCEANQRSTAAAIRQLRREWRRGDTIPGYDPHADRTSYPAGWSQRNLQRLAPDQATLTMRRIGIRAAKKHLPQDLRTRVGLWVGSHYQLDDVWHDNHVRHRDAVCRVLEFGVLDVYSASRFAWGSKPRMPRDAATRAGLDGGYEGLTEREFRLFLAAVLWTHGYSLRGTTLMLEHGTAALRGTMADLLADSTGGLVQATTGGLSGEQQDVLGLWGGRNGGHGNFKSALESLHNLIHNELAMLPGQTGLDREHAPESTYGLVRYQERLTRWAQSQPPEIVEALRHPILDYSTQFVPIRDRIYRELINGRTDHDLEGWAKAGHLVTEYTATPGGGDDTYFTLDALPEASRSLILAAARTDPATWTRQRPLSPGEVFDQGSGDLQRCHPTVIADLIGADEGKERKVRGSYITFTDADIDPHDEIIYEARLLRADGTEHELPHGEKINALVNPFAPEQLIALDARGRCLGTARRVHRRRHGDDEAWERVMGRNNQRTADRLRDQRERWEPAVQAAGQLREHNAALGFPGGNPRHPRRDDGTREAERHQREQTPRLPTRETALPEAERADIHDDSDCPFT